MMGSGTVSTSHFNMMRDYLNALFVPHDVIEVRPIELWVDGSRKRQSRVFSQHRRWSTRDKLLEEFHILSTINRRQNANIFIGVNPRKADGCSTKSGVQTVRSLWLDIDHTTVCDSLQRLGEVELPDPSIVVDSGHGVHVYWLLDREYRINSIVDRLAFENTLRSIGNCVRCDAVFDVSRLLRLPGFNNCKNARNGEGVILCRLIRCEANERHQWNDFEHFRQRSARTPQEKVEAARSGPWKGVSELKNLAREQAAAIEFIARQLDDRVDDRSRRDFAVVCKLIRLGLGDAQIWEVVKGRSKFADGRWKYFDTTIANARRLTDR